MASLYFSLTDNYGVLQLKCYFNSSLTAIISINNYNIIITI